MSELVQIPLGGGAFALIDAADEPLVGQFKWHARLDGRTTYALRSVQLPSGSWSHQRLHTLLTGGLMTDHVNGNGLDNRRCNLRTVSSLENARNKRKCQRPTSSPFKGVSWVRRESRWVAQISANKKGRHLGLFRLELDAARAYDTAARSLFGEFAALNFPNPGERSALTGDLVPT